MAMSMIERVARALCEIEGGMPGWTASGMGMPGPEDNEPQWKLYEEEARAAIAAMREPTEAILKVIARDLPADGHGVEFVEGDAPDYWRSMIDAALQERVVSSVK